jgi:hypothetical protein
VKEGIAAHIAELKGHAELGKNRNQYSLFVGKSLGLVGKPKRILSVNM